MPTIVRETIKTERKLISLKRAAATPVQKTADPLVGRTVFFKHEGQRLAGKCTGVYGENVVVRLAVPDRQGVLIISDSEAKIKLAQVEQGVPEPVSVERQVKRFEVGLDLKLAEDQKAVEVLDKDGKIEDYKDVYIEGFASTFAATTPRDRGGDYILPGAFDQTLSEFRKNPVILVDHRNEVSFLAGSWEKLSITQQGLAVRGKITNSPAMRDLRFKLVEGHLKGLSIGGIFHYLEDRYGIDDIDLFEISIVCVPMNPDALMEARSITIEDCRKAFELHRGRKSQPASAKP
ncbi:MAG: HK97 family phage prohead protease [Opitutaceae bacterium]|nr:HK97 family phage prohead protease [Opitutaceae bacterium]